MRQTFWAAVALLVAGLGISQTPVSRVNEMIEEGVRLYRQGKLEPAEKLFRDLIRLASSERNAWGEAEGHRCLGMLLNKKAEFNLGRDELNLALELHRATGDHLALGRTLDALGYNDWAMGDRGGARELYIQALKEFEESGNKREVATELYNIAFTATTHEDQSIWIPKALDAAKAIDNRRLEGVICHLWGDNLFREGDYRQAIAKLQDALRLLEEAHETAPQAGVFLSLGRLYLTHVRPAKALEYYHRALEITRSQGNKITETYCLRSIAYAQDQLDRPDDAIVSLEAALRIARQARSPKLIRESLTNYADALNRRGKYEEAIKLLKELPGTEWDHASHYAASISEYHLRHYQEAAEAATLALEHTEEIGFSDSRFYAARALAYDKLGRTESSLSDIRRALAIVESNRAKLIPVDYLKRGFEEGKAGLYEAAIDLFHRAGLRAEAFEVAEKARARAFLDLVASRELQRGIDDPIPPDLQVPRSPKEDSIELKSLASVPALSAKEVQRRAHQLSSTLLSYWVGNNTTWIWVIPPEGEIQSVSVAVSASRLGQLVQQSAVPNLGLTRGPSGTRNIELLTRGGARLRGPASTGDPWRDLYRILMEPVVKILPHSSTKNLTIVPHGPLFCLSFAALKNAGNRYLIEDFTLAYAPSVALPGFSSIKKLSENQIAPDYLFVADPRGMPPDPEGRALPPLPGAQKEALDVAKLFRGSPLTLLMGSRANEPAVRTNLKNKRVIHFATHGVLQDQRPFESYLALGKISKSASADGRFTAAEIYNLQLNADLVVLSACRSGLGPITGDGVNGLTRAFFYAGADTIMATLWDVPDQPTQRLILRFYRHYRRGEEKSLALRTAQLELLDALRRGEISAETALGPVKLPENPYLWAGFVVIGKP